MYHLHTLIHMSYETNLKILIYYLQHSTNYLHTRLCHVTFMVVIRSLWYRVFVKENTLIDARRWQSVAKLRNNQTCTEKILSDGTDVDRTAKYRRARTESLEYLSELSFHHADSSCTEYLSLMWSCRFNNVNKTKWLNWYEHNSNLKYWTIKSVFELNLER
jgi:hypothetical protein